MVQLSKLAGLGLMLAPIYAHPGHDVTQENLERRAYYDSAPKTKRSLDHCSAQLKARGLDTASLGRRAVAALPADAPLKKRSSDIENYEYSHNYTAPNITSESAAVDLFSNTSASTSTSGMLVPEAIAGPYYVYGESIRRNITQQEKGVPLTLALQFIDVNTCEPVPDLFIDIWMANSTGVYSGVDVSGNGNVNDTRNLNTTALRGIGLTDEAGITIFDSIFPGHYTGRTNHIHVLTHTNTTTYMNNTISPGSTAHVGQLYFDEALVNITEATYPYNTNTQVKTYNDEDAVLIVETDTAGIDPFVKYAYVGDDITDGLLGWMSIGIDASASQNVSAGAYLYKTGGVTLPGDLQAQAEALVSTLLLNGQTAVLDHLIGTTSTQSLYASSTTFATSTTSAA